MANRILRLGWMHAAAVAVATLLVGAPASAVTVNPGDNILDSFNMAPNSTEDIFFEPTTYVVVSIISVAGTGFSNGDDLALVLFGVDGADTGFSVISDNGETASAEGMLASFVATESFFLNFSALGTDEEVGITYSFRAREFVEVTAVPLPASGLLLGFALLGGGWLLRRRLRR